MTLIQVLADETHIYMSGDFRLTHPVTRQCYTDEAHKLVRATTTRVSAYIGVTGLGYFGSEPIGAWIARTAATAGPTADLPDILEALQDARLPLAAITDAKLRRHTFVVAAMLGTQSSISLVSNFERLDPGGVTRSDVAADDLQVTTSKPKRPRLVIAGAYPAVTDSDRERLLLALRTDSTPPEILQLLAEVNRLAHTRDDSISEGCYTASLDATGRGSTRPFLTAAQVGDFIPPDSNQLVEQLLSRFPRAIGPNGRPQQIRVLQSGQVTQRLNSDKDFREQFKLRPDDHELCNAFGIFLAKRNRDNEAIDAYQRSLKLNPTYAHAMANLANLLWGKRNQVAEAAALYEQAVAASQPSVPSLILSNYALFCEQALSDPLKASQLHEQAAIDENYPLATARFAYFLHGTDIDRADALMSSAIKRQPTNADVLVLAGKLRWFGHQDVLGARDHFLQANSDSPKNTEALLWVAQSLQRSGDAASAVGFYQRLSKLTRLTPEIEGNYGLSLLADHKPDGALRHLSRAAKQRPDDLNILTNLAATLFVLRRTSQSVELIQTLLSRNPTPELEMELLAMLHIATPSQLIPTRLTELAEQGIATDATTLRAMAQGRDRTTRETALQMAAVLEKHLQQI